MMFENRKRDIEIVELKSRIREQSLPEQTKTNNNLRSEYPRSSFYITGQRARRKKINLFRTREVKVIPLELVMKTVMKLASFSPGERD